MDTRRREVVCIVERGRRRLALPAWAVRGVLGGGTLTSVPCAPAHVVGLVSERGAPLPVVSLDPWLDQPAPPRGSGEAVLVLECDGLRFGLVIDRFGGVAWLPAGAGLDAAAAGAVVRREIPADGGPMALLDPAALTAAVVAAADAALAWPPRAAAPEGSDGSAGAGRTPPVPGAGASSAAAMVDELGVLAVNAALLPAAGAAAALAESARGAVARAEELAAWLAAAASGSAGGSGA